MNKMPEPEKTNITNFNIIMKKRTMKDYRDDYEVRNIKNDNSQSN